MQCGWHADERLAQDHYSLPVLLSDPLDHAGLELLRLIYQGSSSGTADWPVWQWVAGRAAQRGLDAEALLRGLPEFLHHYRPVRGPGHGVAPQPEDRLALTVYGLAQVNDPVLLPAFLAALTEATEAAAGHVTSPQEVRPLVLRGEEILPKVRARAGYRGDEYGLHALLAGEPATWSGHTQPGPGRSWSWDLTRVGLQGFAGVHTAGQYLERLEVMVGWPTQVPMAAYPLPALALPEALDHLSAQWRLATGGRLLHTRRTETAATLALPVTSRAELQAALSAFADLLDGLNPGGVRPKGLRSLGWLKLRLTDLLPAEDLPGAHDAVDALRQVVQLRVDGQHSGSDAYRDAQRARAALGLTVLPGPPDQEWEALRHAAVDALRALRLAVGRRDDTNGAMGPA